MRGQLRPFLFIRSNLRRHDETVTRGLIAAHAHTGGAGRLAIRRKDFLHFDDQVSVSSLDIQTDS